MERESLTELKTDGAGSRKSSFDAEDGGVVDGKDFSISVDDLKILMKEKRPDNVKMLEDKFGGKQGLLVALKTSSVQGILGLDDDIKHRASIFGSNYIPPKPPKTFLRLVWESLEDTILRILIVAALFSLGLGMIFEGVEKGWIEGFAILIAVVIVSLVTAINDYQKEKQFRNLQGKIESEHKVAVIRGGEQQQIVTKELVVGDLCQLKYGDVVPADGIIVQNNDLKIDESSLTGESDIVKKGEKDPSLYSGTHVTEGSCKMVVTAVGQNSQAGIIFSLLGAVDEKNNGKKKKSSEEKIDPPSKDQGKFEDIDLNDGGDSSGEDETDDKKDSAKSVLQAKLTKLAVTIGWIGVGAAVITTVVLILRFTIETYGIKKQPWKKTHLLDILKSFIVGVTIMVVAIPEGLPLAVTIALAYSVKRMLDDKNLVRHLDACETMGNATAICSDKTGTLTTNRMTVVESYQLGEHYKSTPSTDDMPRGYIDLLCRSIALNTNSQSRIQVCLVSWLPFIQFNCGSMSQCFSHTVLYFGLNFGSAYDCRIVLLISVVSDI